jgi:hypothetical protein
MKTEIENHLAHEIDLVRGTGYGTSQLLDSDKKHFQFDLPPDFEFY